MQWLDRMRPASVAVVDLQGMIGPAVRPMEFARLLARLREDQSVRAVVLNIDSPGGTAVGSEMIARAVRRLRAEKPTAAFIGGIGASGGYMIAASCERIVALPSSIVGAIGVISYRPIVHEALDRLGVQMHVGKSGRLKDMSSPFREPTEEEREKEQRLLDSLYDLFVESVASGRGLDSEHVRELATGEVYAAADAIASPVDRRHRRPRRRDRLGGGASADAAARAAGAPSQGAARAAARACLDRADRRSAHGAGLLAAAGRRLRPLHRGPTVIIPFGGKTPQIAESAWIAPGATIIGDVVIGERSSVWPGAVIRGDYAPIRIGADVNVQDNVVLHCDEALTIGNDVTIGHAVVVHGREIGDEVLIGNNATVMPGVVIGSNSIVGAGALVPPEDGDAAVLARARRAGQGAAGRARSHRAPAARVRRSDELPRERAALPGRGHRGSLGLDPSSGRPGERSHLTLPLWCAAVR